MITDNNNADIQRLQNQLSNFAKQKEVKKTSNIANNISSVAAIYNVFADLLSGIITAMVVYYIYVYFFGKNITVLTLLLLVFSLTGLYLFIKSCNYNKN